MSVRCSAKQVAEAVLIWSSHNGSNPVLCIEFEDIERLKYLDIFLSTLVVFSDAFSSEMKYSYKESLEETSLSKKRFIEYLKPRALLLAEKNGYFDFMLICTYFSEIVKCRAFNYNCFHLARVACKLLTRILEDGFREIFETDSGWENLISYCRSIHAAVFPSKENRPPGYEPYPKMGFGNEAVLKVIENSDKPQFLEEFDENKLSKLKRKERKEMFLAEVFGLVPAKEESSYSSSVKDDSSDGESITDDTTYWKYFNLDRSTICERITDSEAHLKHVYNLLKKLKQNIDATCISSNEYDISISDDEYIEQLEKKDDESNFIGEEKIVFSDLMKKCYANKICEEENERQNQVHPENIIDDQVHPENIIDDQILEYFLNELASEYSKCKICDGKMRTFMENWRESFHGKYSNSTIVSDVIKCSE